MIFGRNRVDEDLARIREVNLPDAQPSSARKKEAGDGIGMKDVLAMILAVFSVILPYVLGFMAIMGLAMLSMYFWMV